MSKKEKTAETSKKRGRKFLKVLGCFFAVIVAFVLVTTIITLIGDSANLKKAKSFSPVEYSEDRLVPVLNEDGNYDFVTDRELKIVQLTDVHIGGGWMSLKKDAMALNAVAAMITAEKPDLVIVTGDIAYPVPFQAGTFNNKLSANIFANLMEALGVYWTLGFGNHDTELYSYYSRDQIGDLYLSDDFSYCLFTKGPEDVDGVGNQVIRVKNSEGIITQALYVLDSHSYVDGDYLGIAWKYDDIHENQIDWYKADVEKNNAENAALAKEGEETETVSSLMFFHIPTEEYKTAWEDYVNNGFNDTDDVKCVYGTAGETGKVVYCGMHGSDLFETIQEIGSTKGIFCGHDHKNNFSLDYKGIRLTYGMSVDYLAYPGIYKLGAQRGCTVITVTPDGEFSCTAENYYQDKYTSVYEKEAVTMQTVEPITDIEQ